MKTKTDIINETAAHYNLNNRSMATYLNCSEEEVEDCAYVGDDGQRCAFSRCCKEDQVTSTRLKDLEGKDADYILKQFGQEFLKDEYQGHPNIFWQALQRLHDDSYNWTETGLSEYGGREVKRLLLQFAETEES